jgi:hypothetical protein
MPAMVHPFMRHVEGAEWDGWACWAVAGDTTSIPQVTFHAPSRARAWRQYFHAVSNNYTGQPRCPNFLNTLKLRSLEDGS